MVIGLRVRVAWTFGPYTFRSIPIRDNTFRARILLTGIVEPKSGHLQETVYGFILNIRDEDKQNNIPNDFYVYLQAFPSLNFLQK